MRLIIVVGTVIVVITGGYFLASITYPFIIGFIVAFLMNPFVNFLEGRLQIPRVLAVIITLCLLFAVVTAMVTLLVAEIISGSNYLAQSVPNHFQTLVHYLETFFVAEILPIYHQFLSLFNTLDIGQKTTVMNYIQSFSSQIATNVSNWIQQVLTGLSDLLLSLPNLATVLIFSFLATFFISKDWYRLTSMIEKTTPKKVVKSFKHVLYDLKQAFFGFMLAQLTLISMTCMIVLIGLFILKVEYPVTVALLIAIVDLIPYLGTGLIFLPWMIYTFFSGQLPLTIGLATLYAIVLLQRQLMEPKILAQNIGIDPLATLVSLFAGFQLFGFLGLLIGPTVLILIRTLHRANVFIDLKNFVIGKK
ncbi:sporulation integral membrane protein YtvI [Desertibacillus haloalkaliphilus]|nr:sporulation integral membrane protein YtvI [Desertibacillus haloalkaliphilus]